MVLFGKVIATSDITADNDGKVFTFSPINNLAKDTDYVVVLSDKITDKADNPIAETSFKFTTGDYVAPDVTMLSPTTNASISPLIMLKFSKAVQNVSSSTVQLHEGSPTGSKIAISELTPDNENTYTFTPLANLKKTTSYYVVINNAITDHEGNSLDSTSLGFATGGLSGTSCCHAGAF